MTYCLAMRLDEGLFFLADTRTNAGVDNVGTYRKLHVLRPGDDRIFIVEQRGADGKGRIKILKDGVVQPVPFMITSNVATGNEEGLLGLAFAPDYAQSRAFWIYYTDTSGNNHVARHRTFVNNPDRADSIGTNITTKSGLGTRSW